MSWKHEATRAIDMAASIKRLTFYEWVRKKRETDDDDRPPSADFPFTSTVRRHTHCCVVIDPRRRCRDTSERESFTRSATETRRPQSRRTTGRTKETGAARRVVHTHPDGVRHPGTGVVVKTRPRLLRELATCWPSSSHLIRHYGTVIGTTAPRVVIAVGCVAFVHVLLLPLIILVFFLAIFLCPSVPKAK